MKSSWRAYLLFRFALVQEESDILGSEGLSQKVTSYLILMLILGINLEGIYGWD